MKKNLIIYDFDGTLIDTFQAFLDYVVLYSKQNGLPDPYLDVLSQEYGSHKLVKDLGWGLPVEEQHKILIKIFDSYDERILKGEIRPSLFSKVKDTLQNLDDNTLIQALCTSRTEETAFHLSQNTGIYTFFKSFRTLDDVKRRGHRIKPFPDKINCLLEELNVAPTNAVMIGDTTMDIEAGRAAGVKTIGVTWGAHKKEALKQAGANVIIENNLAEILEHI